MSTQLENLRNRIQASAKSKNYNERNFVDVARHDLERFLKTHDALVEALKHARLVLDTVPNITVVDTIHALKEISAALALARGGK